MWATETLWLEIAIASFIYALGNILMRHLEEQTPKLWRVVKYLLTICIICTLSILFSQTAAFMVLAVFLLPVIYVHGYYLRKKKGINEWTGEPMRKYCEFRKWNKDLFSK